MNEIKLRNQVEPKKAPVGQQIQPQSTKNKKNIQCFKCSGPHYYSNCPNRQKSSNEPNEEFNILKMDLLVEDKNNPGDLQGLVGSINGKDTYMLIDSGASHCFMSNKLFKKLKIEGKENNFKELKVATGLSSTNLETLLKLDINGFSVEEKFNIVNNLNYDIILGKNFLTKVNARLDFANGIIFLAEEEFKLVGQKQLITVNSDIIVDSLKENYIEVYSQIQGRLLGISKKFILKDKNVFLSKGINKIKIFAHKKSVKLEKGNIIGIVQDVEIKNFLHKAITTLALEDLQDSKLSEIILEYETVLKKLDDKRNLTPHTIRLEKENPFICIRNYSMNQEKRLAATEEVKKLIIKDKIIESTLPWNSPLL